DVVEYVLVAQDLLGNVSISNGSFNADPTSVSSIAAAQFPITGDLLNYRISEVISADTIYVGSGNTFMNLTSNDGLFKYMNDNVLANDLTIVVTSNLSEN